MSTPCALRLCGCNARLDHLSGCKSAGCTKLCAVCGGCRIKTSEKSIRSGWHSQHAKCNCA
jgi:hypothetical protein